MLNIIDARRNDEVWRRIRQAWCEVRKGEMSYTVEPGYNDIGLYDTPHITSDILWYQSVPHCHP